MNIWESFKIALATLSANRLRSTLTMLGIVIGNASVITMVGVGQGAQRYAAGQFESLGPNTLFIVPGTPQARNRTFNVPQTLVLADAEAIARQVPTVKEVAPQIQSQQQITFSNRNLTGLVVGTTPSFLTVRSFEVAQGRFIADADVSRQSRVAVLGSDMASKLFLRENPIGQQIRIKNLTFDVVGVLKEKGAFLGNNQDEAIYIPVTTMANRIVGQRSPYGIPLTFISISARDQDSIDAAKYQITNLLRLRHQTVNEDDFTIQTQKEALSIIGNISNALTLMLAAIAGISLFVGGIGIMNIMLVSVTERTQEIGLRKAIGATQTDILWQFMIEAMILSAAGGLIGTGLGVAGVMVIAALTPLEAGVAPIAVILAVGVSGSIGLFFGVVPARRAAQLDPIVALRSA